MTRADVIRKAMKKVTASGGIDEEMIACPNCFEFLRSPEIEVTARYVEPCQISVLGCCEGQVMCDMCGQEFDPETLQPHDYDNCDECREWFDWDQAADGMIPFRGDA